MKGSKYQGPSSREIIERRIRDEFWRRAHHYVVDLPDDDDDLEWLALMQHHGSPTRLLLDWTLSPFVAAFFAAVDPALCGQKRSAICAIDVDGLRGEANRMLREAGCAEIDQIDLTDAPSKENFRRVFFEEESLPLRVTRRQDSRQ